MSEFNPQKLIKLQMAFGVGSARAFSIYCAIENGGKYSEKELEKLNEIDDTQIEEIINDCKNNQIDILTIDDEKYPDILRNISIPPLVLFVKGKMPDFDNDPVICVVGPRKVTDFGRRASYSLSRRLSKAGMIVVSGGALGTDSAAHKGALSVNGTTVAVLGCGILCDYLPQNRELRKEISETGCLISEYPPNFSASKYTFPVRNRLMSALSYSTVIVEAGYKSGALITAKHALEQGKDLFVIPGNPTNYSCKGSNALLRDGAIPLLDASDVFNLYIPKFADKIDVERAFSEEKRDYSKKIIKKTNISLSKQGEIVYNNIVKKKFLADDFVSTGLGDEEILSALTELEIEGLIKSLPGGIYEIL